MCADLIGDFGIDLWDPAVQDRPWPGIRALIYDLAATPTTRLGRALRR